MLLRVVQTLQHVFRPMPCGIPSISGRSAFSSCRPTFLARSGPADEVLTPQPSQTPQDLDEAASKYQQRQASGKLGWQKLKQDPIALEQRNLRKKLYNRRWWQEQNKDRASREQYLDNQIKYNETMMAKYKEDLVLPERYYALRREEWRRTSASYHMKRHQTFNAWFHKHKDCLDTFTWV
jgi:hypothetical protein